MRIVNNENTIPIEELTQMSEKMFGNLVKAVVDVDRKIMVVDAEMHSDQEAYMLANGSSQQSLWGINIYPEFFGNDDLIEFDSMINLRPSQNNRSRSVTDLNTQNSIRTVVNSLITK